MRLTMYQVDAFTDRLFAGNPAAVVPLREWLDSAVMQAIAAENNLSETAFFVPRDDAYDLRWFTPRVEVELCGHATFASGYVILFLLSPTAGAVDFDTRSGRLRVVRSGDELAMELPAATLAPWEPPPEVVRALGAPPELAVRGRDPMLVYRTQRDIEEIRPDFGALAQVAGHGVIVTAPGDGCDLVSRFFAPAVGIDEDPVTGSAHCTLVPYWAERLGRARLRARQLSARGGDLGCELRGGRVELTGRAVLYLEGTIQAGDPPYGRPR